jgi:hypothetical protein
VDAAEPGGIVLISPGVYQEAVVVTTPFLTIRGLDRNRVILDGGFTLDNGIQVIEADGVTIENMTARHYVVNGFLWSGVFGYRGSYLTAFNDGDYGLFEFDSRYGQRRPCLREPHRARVATSPRVPPGRMSRTARWLRPSREGAHRGRRRKG